MTRPGVALRLALRDLYENSWRLVPVNALLGLVLALAVVGALAAPPAFLLAVLGGPVAAALVHGAVTLVRTGSLAFTDVVRGFELHWRRGLALAAPGTACLGLAVVALRFYGRSSTVWPLAFVVLYLALVAGVYQVVLWTVAIAEPARPLRAAARDAAELVARRPGRTLALGLALLAVNAAGVAVAVMPFLTVTVAYSFLAAARFVITPEDSASWPRSRSSTSPRSSTTPSP